MGKWHYSDNYNGVEVGKFYEAKRCLPVEEFAGRKIAEVIEWPERRKFFLKFVDGTLSCALEPSMSSGEYVPTGAFQEVGLLSAEELAEIVAETHAHESRVEKQDRLDELWRIGRASQRNQIQPLEGRLNEIDARYRKGFPKISHEELDGLLTEGRKLEAQIEEIDAKDIEEYLSPELVAEYQALSEELKEE